MFNLLKTIRELLSRPGNQERAENARKHSPVQKKSSGQNRRKNTNPRQRLEKCDHSADVSKPKKSAKRNKKSNTNSNVQAILPFPAPKVKPERPAVLKDIPEAAGKKRFLDFPLPEAIQFGIQNMNFEYCTPIQEQALPELLAGRDLGGKAQTGTGKTAAFLLAAFTRIANNPMPEQPDATPRVLVLAPTRELAIQIHKDAEAINVFADYTNVVVFGGMDHDKQRKTLQQKIDILAGTPGRIIDYVRSGALNLSKVEVLVIDEADRMLDMGFIPDVRRIVAQLPDKGIRQTMLFSATLEPEIMRLAQSFLHEPVMVETEPEQVVGGTIEQTFYSVAGSEKLAMLLYLIKNEPFERMIIFGNRKDKNLDVFEALQKCNIAVELMSGDIAQQKRMRILEDFRSGKVKIIIATDVAARGIHVDNVSLVVNYDLPERSEDYVHRIGRTGRAGQQGKAVSFICEYGAYYMPDIEKYVGETFNSTLPAEDMVKIPEEYATLLKQHRSSHQRRSQHNNSGSRGKYRRR
ncbi:MAG: DEAD/DEAH box helicase [Lentisphaerae bacterium]|nr:DEAD/DEAH box helicase [Lentisphaerota bacterium]